MADIQDRLIQCFQAVFPDLNESDIKRADVDRVGPWDSMATVTLAATVEEEFGIQFDPTEVEELTSYKQFLQCIEQKAGK
jgi:acyl carrier protein